MLTAGCILVSLHIFNLTTLQLTFKDEQNNRRVTSLTSPCLVPSQSARACELKITSDRYFPLTLEMDERGSVLSHTVVYVKKKSGHLSYVQDPHALRSLSVQAGGSSGSVLDLIRSFTEDPRLLAFAEFLCNTYEQTSSKAVSFYGAQKSSSQHGEISTSTKTFCAETLFECLTQDKMEVLPMLLSLRSCIMHRDTISVCNLWDLRLLRSMTMHRTSSIVNAEFVALLCEHVDRYFANAGFAGNDALMYFKDPWNYRNPRFGAFMVWFEVPSPFGCV